MSDESAYSRVTNRERFAALHDAARVLVRELEARYQVTVEAVEPDQAHNAHEVLAATRVSSTGGGAPVTVAWTAFPGLSVRFGQWHVERFPDCGCDGCDEQLDDVAEHLRRKVASVVAGDFAETQSSYEFVYPDGGNSGSSGGLTQRWLRGRTRRYEAWPLRAP